MKFIPKNVLKYQMGGAMPVDEGAPVEETPIAPTEATPEQGGQDPLMMIAQAAAQALQSQDCQMAMQVCQAFLQLVSQAQGAPAEEQGTPVFAKGGVLKRRIKK